ncbi:MAG TPA: pyridoxamine 5'-phosphate oxidase family protein [Ramlibacter sp.]|uniref:pyridoxamine 5'-phosphate oxidase family protein n=1 Tax=Ramlibacter sp. TaxID=1917967 RepID=UPI002ED04FA2
MILALARKFQQARSNGADARGELLALLHPEVRYMVLGKELAGAEAVAAELLAGHNGELSRRLDWHAPEKHGHEVRLAGERRAGTRDRGLVVTLGFEGDAITLVQEQRTPAPPPEAQPLALPEALKRRIDNALAERHPMLMSHVDAQGQPILSFRGSVQVFGDDQLALWIRAADGGFIRAIRENPRVALMYRDEDAKATYQFQGRARVTQDEAERRRVFERAPAAERAHDFAMLGVAVVVDLDRVEGYAGLGPQGQVDGIRMLRGAQPQ